MIKLLSPIRAAFSRWIVSVVEAVAILVDRYKPPPVIELAEGNDGAFGFGRGTQQMQTHHTQPGPIGEAELLAAPSNGLARMFAGNRVELSLQSRRFLFSPLELPGRAAEFLPGIVRTQIDRLTPWSPTDAAFGWSEPEKAGTDRITLTVAATAHALLARYVEAIERAGAHSIVVRALSPQGAAIKVLERSGRSRLDLGAMRRALVTILAVAVGLAASTMALSGFIGAGFDARQEELAGRIAQARAAAVTARDAGGSSNTKAMRMLETRKRNDPSSLIALEMLSRILPDHTYVTELRVEGNKLRLTGITRDAPSLIGLIEQSPRFSRATFFAPTTRLPSEPGERFHIEAQIQPVSSPRS